MHHIQSHGPRRTRRIAAVVGAGAMAAGAAIVAATSSPAVAVVETSFHHVGSFNVTDNLDISELLSTPTSAEISDVSDDGETLIYSDALTKRIGFVDISDPSNPEPRGVIDLDPADPTSVAVLGDLVLAAVKTSGDDYDNPAGELRVYDVARNLVRTIDLDGQPDSIAVSPDERFVAIAIENERDEDQNDGLIPQAPAGFLQVVDVSGDVADWTTTPVDLAGLADVAPSDPEPEYVHIDRKNRAIVTLQENNHVVVVDLRKARVIRDFSAGSALIDDVDATEEELGPQGNGLIELADDLGERRREPDSIVWLDETRAVTANEGDYEDENGVQGGSRSFTIFNVNSGKVAYEAFNTFEHEVVRAGHYPEGRSENKGSEPEGLEIAEFGGRDLLFVGAERANVVEVWDVTNPNRPDFLQLLPTGIGPEGITAIPERNLLAVTSEVDGFDEDPGDEFPARSIITLFEFGEGAPYYPYIESSNDGAGLPIPWVALSGLSGDPNTRNTLWAVSDSFLAQSWIYQVDVSSSPAVIVERIPVGANDGAFDLEGIAARPEGGFWLASEGRGTALRRNQIIRVDSSGAIVGNPIGLPADLVAIDTSSGFEGVAVTGTAAANDEAVWVVIQRSWPDDAPGVVKLGRYDVSSNDWTFANYELDAPEDLARDFWIGLSEITVLPNGNVAIVERDNQIGPLATTKKLYEVDLSATEFLPYGGTLNTVEKTLLEDLLDELDDASITIPDKIEGFAVEDGRYFMVTDNDGVDENYGETIFKELAINLGT